MSGGPDDPPVQTHIAYGDACGGLFSAAALLTALYHKRRTGEGQRVDLSQVETNMQLGVHGIVHQGLQGTPPPRMGSRHPIHVPQGCFPVTGEDRWIVVSVTDDEMWPRLAHIIGRSDLADAPDLATAAGRRAREDELESAIADWTRGRSQEDAMQTLQASGVAAGRVARPLQLLDDPILEAREFWQVVDRAYVGPKPHPAMPYRMNGQRGAIRHAAPLLGEHSEQVLRDVLGLGQAEIEGLVASGVIARPPAVPEGEDAT
jgi:crotonobetainyl-CoA:carnitine CoA-transferase CaiB-like acyl-CoA transferase